MIHREYGKVKHIANVEASARRYREAWSTHDGSYAHGLVVKHAEWMLNLAVESAIAPRES